MWGRSFKSRTAPPIKQEPMPSHGIQISDDINQMKLEALSLGKFTDCVFLVGPDDGIQEEVHAVKGIMMMSSSFMEGLFRSPFCQPTGPIRIQGVEPKIFKLIVEFIHLGLLKTEVHCNDLPDLLIAADLYLIESLKNLCIGMLERDINVSAVWLTLQKLLEIDHLKYVANCCIPLLKNSTEECLEHATFLTTTSKSVNFILKQDDLKLRSEWQLVNYCMMWVSHQKCPRTSFRDIIGGLRLLTLTPKQVSDLPFGYLSHTEIQAIMKFSLNLESPNFPSTLCSKVQRVENKLLDIRSEKYYGLLHSVNTLNTLTMRGFAIEPNSTFQSHLHITKVSCSWLNTMQKKLVKFLLWLKGDPGVIKFYNA